MLYLDHFTFAPRSAEDRFLTDLRRTCYDSIYPYFQLSQKGLFRLQLAPITILYGSNGCGKTTALNIIAEALRLKRGSVYNRSPFMESYVALCEFDRLKTIPPQSAVITSDDVFDYMLDVRTANEGLDRRREELFTDWVQRRDGPTRLTSLADYEQLRETVDARRMTQSRYVRERLNTGIRERSNGESAFLFFREKIEEDGLYLLDEPENSLSPARQAELAQFIEESARFFNCQFVIATHSPFLLAMKGALVYDMDRVPVSACDWTKTEGVRAYWDFFMRHRSRFE